MLEGLLIWCSPGTPKQHTLTPPEKRTAGNPQEMDGLGRCFSLFLKRGPFQVPAVRFLGFCSIFPALFCTFPTKKGVLKSRKQVEAAKKEEESCRIIILFLGPPFQMTLHFLKGIPDWAVLIVSIHEQPG